MSTVMSRLEKQLTHKRIFIVFLVFFIISMLPIIYCTFFDYATGDDHWQAACTYHALKRGEGLIGAWKAAVAFMLSMRREWQGTWSTLILNSFMPGIWGERFYSLTPWIALIHIMVGTWCLEREVMVRQGGMNGAAFGIVYVTTVFFLIQFMPSARGGIFWFCTVSPYIITHGLACCVIAFVPKYMETGKYRYAFGILLFCAFLGGGGYIAIVYSLVGLFFLLVFYGCRIAKKKEPETAHRVAIPLMAFLLESAGFIVSATAPGNWVRGGDAFGATAEHVIHTLQQCFVQGALRSLRYFITDRPLLLAIPIVVIIAWEGIDVRKASFFRHPWIVLCGGFMLISLVHGPEFYAGTDVSTGVPCAVWLVFLTTFICQVYYLTGYLKFRLPEYGTYIPKIKPYVLFGSVVFVLVFWRHLIGNSVWYTCTTFIESGSLRDYHEQMEERIAIIKNDNSEDVIVPGMANEHGPFPHFPVIEDVTSFGNRTIADYYEKNTVRAIPREEYEKRKME